MSRASGAYANNEIQVYVYLRMTMNLSKAVACGILANIDEESSFIHTDDTGDNGTSYGLCQWHDTRKDDLIKWCTDNNLSHSTVYGQMSFLNYELTQGNEKEAYKQITASAVKDSADGAYTAGYRFCKYYERAEDDEEHTKKIRRGNLAKTYYNEYVDDTWLLDVIANIGSKIVEQARLLVETKQPYVQGGYTLGGFDPAGLVYYCYSESGVVIPQMDAQHYYDEYKDKAESVLSSSIAPGDLIFSSSAGGSLSDGVAELSIATGDGNHITVTKADGVHEKPFSLSRRKSTKILRILDSSQTTINIQSNPYIYTDYEDGSGLILASNTDYSSEVIRFPYESKVTANLARVNTAGFDYGYLIDIVNGGEFKFYVPDFTEAAGAQWENIEIVGRSVNVLAYRNTSSRTVDISLELYAGEGVYKKAPGEPPSEDTVGEIHRDANFLKSLEYPDYTHPITRPPSIVHLILGSAFSMIGVVSGVSINHLKPVDTQNRSMYLKVSFKVTQLATDPPDYKDIREGRYAMISTAEIDTLDTTA